MNQVERRLVSFLIPDHLISDIPSMKRQASRADVLDNPFVDTSPEYLT